MVWSPADGAGPAGQLHAEEFDNTLRAVNGAGVLGHTFSVSVATMTITFPAFNCWVPDGSGALVRVVYAGGTVVIAASDPTNPRTSICQINSSGTVSEKQGTATAETGDVVEAPMPALDSDAIALLKVRVAAGASSLSDSVMKGRAIDVSDRFPLQEGPMAPLPLFPASTGTVAVATNTTMVVGIVSVPHRITVTRVTFDVPGHTTTGTLGIALFSNDGQTRYFNETTASISAISVVTTVLSAAVTLEPGLYYITVNPDGTASMTVTTWDSMVTGAAAAGMNE